MKVHLIVNGGGHDVDVPADIPLLWVLRDELQLTGTKYGCGVGACGACTVHVEGRPIRSCRVLMLAHLLGHSPLGEGDRPVNLAQRAQLSQIHKQSLSRMIERCRAPFHQPCDRRDTHARVSAGSRHDDVTPRSRA